MPRLSKAKRTRSMVIIQAGVSKNAVQRQSEQLKTLSPFWRRFKTTGSSDDHDHVDRPHIGRPRVTTPREDRQTFSCINKSFSLTAVDTAHNALGKRVSPQTV